MFSCLEIRKILSTYEIFKKRIDLTKHNPQVNTGVNRAVDRTVYSLSGIYKCWTIYSTGCFSYFKRLTDSLYLDACCHVQRTQNCSKDKLNMSFTNEMFECSLFKHPVILLY